MWRLLACLSVLAAPAAAQEYDENPSGRSLYALGDLRLTLADGERSWLGGGFGKGRLGGVPDGDAEWVHLREDRNSVEANLVHSSRLDMLVQLATDGVADVGRT